MFFLLDEEEAPALCSSLKTLPRNLILEDITPTLLKKPFYSASLLLYHTATPHCLVQNTPVKPVTGRDRSYWSKEVSSLTQAKPNSRITVDEKGPLVVSLKGLITSTYSLKGVLACHF